MILKFILAGLLLCVSGSSLALDFKIKGKPLQSFDQKSLERNKNASSTAIFEPHMDQVITYVGIPFNDLMDEAVGKSWRLEEEILFTCSDGYQSSIPVSKFKRFKAWLVWSRKDGKTFEISNKFQSNEKVYLGPYYLVWENQKEPELLEGGGTDFPYQIVAIDLISFKDKFPKIAPPAKSAPSVQEGFLLYRKYCLSCHSLDGEGGQKAPDLKLVNPFKRMSLAELRRWILSPQSVKPGTLMPPFGPKLPDRETKADALIEYLKVMIDTKSK